MIKEGESMFVNMFTSEDLEKIKTLVDKLKAEPNKIAIDKQTKKVLVAYLLAYVYEAMCTYLKTNSGWICGFGQERRIERARDRIVARSLFTDEELVMLAFEIHFLNDPELFKELKKQHHIETDKVLKTFVKLTPKPFFHRRIKD